MNSCPLEKIGFLGGIGIRTHAPGAVFFGKFWN